MMYRYRLKKSEENLRLKSRNVDGVVLYVNRWYYTPTPLKTPHSDIVVEEHAESKKEFAVRDAARREQLEARRRAIAEQQRLQQEREQKAIEASEPAMAPQYQYSEDLIDSLQRSELIDLGRALLFGDEELTDLDEHSLRELIKMDLTLE